MSRIFFLTGSKEELGPRSQAVRGIITRRAELEGNSTAPLSHEEALEAVKALRERGVLFLTGSADAVTELVYIPSEEARAASLSDAEAPGLGEKVTKRHRKAARTTEGALFRFPAEHGTWHLECFITDWSPFPAAAAIAVHGDHPAARGARGEEKTRFTGHYVRHPLTGDLLPVWVAAWVKPEFGTGAVVVNPAHCEADLRFGREVGLPIRFGLVRSPVSCEPATWPTPPIIKDGVSTKTGRLDGLTVQEAMAAYFQELSGQGSARRHVDRGVGACTLGVLQADASGAVDIEALRVSGAWRSGTAEPSHPEEPRRARMELAPWLQALLAMKGSPGAELLVPLPELASTLLFTRMLHFDLYGQPLEPRAVHFVQELAAAGPQEPEIAGLASLLASGLEESGSLKSQFVEQAQVFRERHAQLAGRIAGPVQPPAEGGRSAVRIKQALVQWNLKEAFSSLYALQKQLMNASSENDAQLSTYCALAYVLGGVPCPEREGLAQAWARLG